MNFKGIEVNALYANHLWKKIKHNQLIYKEKQKKDNPFQITSLQEKYPLKKTQKSCKKNVWSNTNESTRPFLASSFFKEREKKDNECLNPKTSVKKNTFYSDVQFLCKLRNLLTLYLYRHLLIKRKKLDTYKIRLKRTKILAKKTRVRSFRKHYKKQLVQEHYRFFFSKKPALNFNENRLKVHERLSITKFY